MAVRFKPDLVPERACARTDSLRKYPIRELKESALRLYELSKPEYLIAAKGHLKRIEEALYEITETNWHAGQEGLERLKTMEQAIRDRDTMIKECREYQKTIRFLSNELALAKGLYSRPPRLSPLLQEEDYDARDFV